MSNIITDMGIGIPSGLSKADKQRLVDIVNNASNNQDSIKTSMISHVNNKAKTSLPNNSSWINIENAIDGITIEDLPGEDIDTDHLQIVSDRFNTIFTNSELSNIKYITSDNKYVSNQADVYDSDMNLIKNIVAHFDCKDKNDNFYMLSYNSTELTNPHDHSFNGTTMIAYDYIISMTLKKYDSNFNLVFSKDISFTLPDMHYSKNDEGSDIPYPTIFKISQVLCTDTYIYFFILINDNETWNTGIFHALRMKLDGSNISIVKTIEDFDNTLNLSCLYSSKNFITFQGIIRYTSTHHYEFHILLDDNRKVTFEGANDYSGLYDVLSMCFDDTYIYTAIGYRMSNGQQSLRLFITKISDLEDGDPDYIYSSSTLILTIDASSTSSISQTVGEVVQINKSNEFIFLGGIAVYWMRSLNNKSFYGSNIPSSNNNNNLVLFDKEGYILCGIYKVSSKIKYTVIA